MEIKNKIISVSGEKISSLVISENELQLLDKNFSNLENFKELWDKTLTLTNKVKIEYSKIKSITKENDEEYVFVKYSGTLGMSKECKIEFTLINDQDAFYDFFQKDKNFSRTDETMSKLKAVKSYLIGAAITIAIVTFSYFQAIIVQSPDFIETEENSRSARKTKFFHNIVDFLGPNGVLFIGGLITAFIAYKIWSKYKNPPILTKLLPLDN